jgi:putative membrane protein
MAATVAFLSGSPGARAADTPNTADVLQKLHHADQKEIAAGKLAETSGKSRQVKDYGRMLQKDHAAADMQVTALAREEKITLSGNPASSDMSDLASDPMLTGSSRRRCSAITRRTSPTSPTRATPPPIPS